jgi:hypothetical protein
MTETMNRGPRKPECIRCGRSPDQIEEYRVYAEGEGLTPDEFVRLEEGTYNPDNGHFACTYCYIMLGSPAAAPGEGRWIAP